MMSWSGSIEIGITVCDPDSVELPACATNLRHGSWIMTSSSIMHDGEPIVELYGVDLDTLEEGNTLGVMRTSKVSISNHFLLKINFFLFVKPIYNFFF